MKRPSTPQGTTMLETMLNLFYAFIFVAGGAAGLAVIATLGTTFITADDARTAIGERPRQARPGK
ncbi:MAG: hypothetical protein ACYTA3_05010 [Planctomycetota bacterium]